MTPDNLYQLLGQLLHEAPDFSGYAKLTPQQQIWLGRAQALVKEAGDIADIATVNVAAQNITTALRSENFQAIMTVLYKTFATAELGASPGTQGAFIPAGDAFTAFAAIEKTLRSARSDLLIVDPYLDHTALTDYAGTIAEKITVRLLADSASVKPTLKPAVQRWQAEYGATRPLEARMTGPRALHDRLIIVDGATTYTLTQSLKDFAARAPASIHRADPQTAALKIAAYATTWASANAL